jgi:hypothetical protein
VLFERLALKIIQAGLSRPGWRASKSGIVCGL